MGAGRRRQIHTTRPSPQPKHGLELHVGGVVGEDAKARTAGLVGERTLAGAGRAGEQEGHLPPGDRRRVHRIPAARRDQGERHSFDHPVLHVSTVGEQGRGHVGDGVAAPAVGDRDAARSMDDDAVGIRHPVR